MVMRLAFQPESAGLVYGGKNAMATYVHLFNFTEQGLRNIKDTVKRAEALKKAASEVGANLKGKRSETITALALAGVAQSCD
jgi:hypothetical protein